MLTHLEKTEVARRWPEFLPGSKAVLFASSPTAITFTNAQVAVSLIGTGRAAQLGLGTSPHFVSSGHLIYAQGER